ncbi:transcription regulator HTH, apses-type DNA-binding domain-containing protein [Spinellus fusiger]|nr:transcription regulator HTH, apses-type DNA-binding domain-containing protein [Spinellus fusiger]
MYGSSCFGPCPSSSPSANHHISGIPAPLQRPKLTTTMWEDEGTACYQVDTKSVCVARRQDNDMINGTKLLNVVGMSRGKRDGILKNEKGRVVVKVGAMHLKGVWITFSRAKDLASKFKIVDLLYPLFVDDPSVFLCASNLQNSSNMPLMVAGSTCGTRPNPLHAYKPSVYPLFPVQPWDRPYQSLPSITTSTQQEGNK